MLPAELVFAWQAFWDLCGDRHYVFNGTWAVPSSILWTALDRYAERHGVVGSEAFDLLRFRVSVLDDAFREAMRPDD